MLSFSEQGDGPALVLIHAYPLDHCMWQIQTDFSRAAFASLRPMSSVSGGSQPPQPWNMADMGKALLALLDQLKIKKCTLVGLSMGGYIAIPFTLAHPDRVERLVLAHTRARADLEAETVARNGMIASVKKDGMVTLADKMLPRLLAANAAADVQKLVRDSIQRASQEACIHAVTAMRDRVDQTAHLGRLHCPTLVITGAADAIIRVEDSERMAAAIPAGKICVIEGTGHLSNLENPPAFNQAIDAFLRAV